MKYTLASKIFASNLFKSGTWTGTFGSSVVVPTPSQRTDVVQQGIRVDTASFHTRVDVVPLTSRVT